LNANSSPANLVVNLLRSEVVSLIGLYNLGLYLIVMTELPTHSLCKVIEVKLNVAIDNNSVFLADLIFRCECMLNDRYLFFTRNTRKQVAGKRQEN
jgi:hypothetical protein